MAVTAKPVVTYSRRECGGGVRLHRGGAGTAGCVLAARLSEDANARVLLVEAGSSARTRAMTVPSAWPENLGSAADWANVTTTGRRRAGGISTGPRRGRIRCHQRHGLRARAPGGPRPWKLCAVLRNGLAGACPRPAPLPDLAAAGPRGVPAGPSRLRPGDLISVR